MKFQWLNDCKKKVVILIIILCILFFFVYTKSAVSQNNNSNLETISNLSLTETNGEGLTWELFADSAIINKNEHIIRLTK